MYRHCLLVCQCGLWERFACTDTVPLCVCSGVWKTFRKSCPSASNTSVRALGAPRVPFSVTGSFTQHVKRCLSATVGLHICQSERPHSKRLPFKKKLSSLYKYVTVIRHCPCQLHGLLFFYQRIIEQFNFVTKVLVFLLLLLLFFGFVCFFCFLRLK